eukprot:421051-Prymnesium_polylepis.4
MAGRGGAAAVLLFSTTRSMCICMSFSSFDDCENREIATPPRPEAEPGVERCSAVLPRGNSAATARHPATAPPCSMAAWVRGPAETPRARASLG